MARQKKKAGRGRQRHMVTPVTEELRQIYREAWEEGIFLCEFGGSGGYLAAAGSVERLTSAEKILGQELDVTRLALVDCYNLGAVPANGPTRETACRNAIKAYKEHYKTT